MTTLAEHWDVADKHDRVCLILPELSEEAAKHKPVVIVAVLEVTDDKIVVGDGSETEFFTTTFSWKGEPIDEGRLVTKRVPASELERLEECRIQGLYPEGRMPVKKYPPKISRVGMNGLPRRLTFYLGAHHPDWLGRARVPLFVSRRTLSKLKTLPRAAAPWALDSGGFTELTMHGRWTLAPRDYVAEVRRYRDEVGSLAWCSPCDWMCEPEMLRKTGLSVGEHQRRTITNYLELRALAPELPIIPVLQGWTWGDYIDCEEAYKRAGVALADLPLVGIGTVCRRQHTLRAGHIIRDFAEGGLRLHGFGFKISGLRSCADALASADSMAWSVSGRRNAPLDGHAARHKNCANCIEYAMQWRADLLAKLGV